jgi:hypothetical protein
MKFSNFSHTTPHLKGKQHQLDPNLDLKQLVHHATVQYVDRDVDGDVDVYDNPKKKIPDENVSSAQKTQEYSNKLIAKQKGEIKHTKRGMAYEDTMNKKSESKKCKPGYYYCFTNKECKPIPPGFMIDPAGMLAKENGHTVDEACWVGYKQVGMKKKGKKLFQTALRRKVFVLGLVNLNQMVENLVGCNQTDLLVLTNQEKPKLQSVSQDLN